jgi:hypothetical protein
LASGSRRCRCWNWHSRSSAGCPAWRRSLAFCLVAELAAMVLRLPALAQDCAAPRPVDVAPVRRACTGTSAAGARGARPG